MSHGQRSLLEGLDLFSFLFIALPLTHLAEIPIAMHRKFVSSFSFGKYLDTFMHKIFSLSLRYLGAHHPKEKVNILCINVSRYLPKEKEETNFLCMA